MCNELIFIFQIFFKDKVTIENGYILFVRKNAIQVLIPKFGLEGTVFLIEPGAKDEGPCIYNAEVGVVVHYFKELFMLHQSPENQETLLRSQILL